MSQHDFDIANQGFPATRADINNAFQAIASNSSGPTAPSTTYANQWWYDTTNDKMYLRNAADSAWIEVAVIDQTNNEWKITSGVIQAVDGDGIVLKTDDGITRFTLDDTGNATFAEGTDIITGSAGTGNVRIGAAAGDSIESGGNNNVLIGTNAGTAITTSSDNVAVGADALLSNTTSTQNTAVGYYALRSNTAGNNTAVGFGAGYRITSGGNSTAIGNYALQASTSAPETTAVGHQAGYLQTTGGYNAFFGVSAGYAVTTGQENTFLGRFAGSAITTGSRNVIVGKYDGNQGGLDIRTSSNNIVLSDGDGNVRLYSNSVGKIGIGNVSPNTYGGRIVSQISGGSVDPALSCVNSSVGGTLRMIDFFQGTSTTRVGSIESTSSSTAYNTSSDYRLKENVTYDWDATTRLKQLKPARFNFIVDPDTTVDGFLAHEAATVVPEAVTGTKDAVDSNGDIEPQGIDQSKLVPLLVKTIQELEARITALEAN